MKIAETEYLVGWLVSLAIEKVGRELLNGAKRLRCFQ